MKTIVICRHAKSDWSFGLPDLDRPLNKRGKKDAPLMGAALLDYRLNPDLIISSPARRALSTAELIAKEIHYSVPIRIDKRIYEGGSSDIITLIRSLPEEVETVMIFGHNPTLEGLSMKLLGMSSDIILPTSGMVCMDSSVDNWKDLKPGALNLVWYLIPRLIRGEKGE